MTCGARGACLGEAQPPAISALGHTDPTLTLRIYAQVMKRRRSEEYRAKANELFGAVLPAASNRPTNRPTDPMSAYAPALNEGPGNDETPAVAGASEESG